MTIDGRKKIEQYKLPESFANWELYESVFDMDYVALVYRHKGGNAWLVAEEIGVGEEAEYIGTLFINEDYPKLISIEAQGLLGLLHDKLGWDLTHIRRTVAGNAKEVYYYVER